MMNTQVRDLNKRELMEINGGDAGFVVGLMALVIALVEVAYEFKQGWDAAKEDAQSS